jgi:hypothetical protein
MSLHPRGGREAAPRTSHHPCLTGKNWRSPKRPQIFAAPLRNIRLMIFDDPGDHCLCTVSVVPWLRERSAPKVWACGPLCCAATRRGTGRGRSIAEHEPEKLSNHSAVNEWRRAFSMGQPLFTLTKSQSSVVIPTFSSDRRLQPSNRTMRARFGNGNCSSLERLRFFARWRDIGAGRMVSEGARPPTRRGSAARASPRAILLLSWAAAISVVVAVAIFSIGGPTELLYRRFRRALHGFSDSPSRPRTMILAVATSVGKVTFARPVATATLCAPPSM